MPNCKKPIIRPKKVLKTCLRPVFPPAAVIRLHDGDLHAVGWGEGP